MSMKAQVLRGQEGVPIGTRLLRLKGSKRKGKVDFAQKERIEGSALREENERFKFENLVMREMLKGELCTPCKDILFSKEERQWILEQLRMENAQLHEKYEELIIGKTGILVSKVPSLPPAPGSSLDAATGSLLGQRIGGLSLDHDLGSRKFIPSTLLYQLKEEQESEKLQMFQTVVNAIGELTSLMVTETLWIKDPTDGRYIIHRDNYEKTFPRISHLKGSHTRFESSKAEGIITWVEHVQVNDKALTHRICRDFVFRGLAYGAERWLLSLQRMGERFACEMVGNATGQDLGGGKRSIMNLTHRMVKNLCASLTMKRKLDIPQLSELNNSGIRVSMFNSMGQGQPQGLIVNATISLWLPHPYQVVFDFLRDEKLRYQPLIAWENNNTLVLQESCIDPLGAIITHAPITIKCLDMALSGADSSTIPILPSGFIISGDGHPDTRARASSSTTRPIAGGSLLTVVYQIPTRNASSSRQVDIELVASIKELVSSTVQDIWSALHCGGID
ncbi:hypothetical protein Acr_00g0021990 [Actinidia rufa]|uniref:HD-Zip IV C-terminal domain-containing protein n=1 Tax=Actinidia rufa TaxID=165716 RepID=A0A7J0DCE0_9ERIC|nr:hypothetical protein Acr_00g0021990 [Actinidia rufa]